MAPNDRSSQRQGMLDSVRRYIDAAVGVTEVPRERAERIVKGLAERGEVRARDLQRAARDLAQRSAKNRQELIRLVRKEIRHQMQTFGVASRADVDRLRKRVAELEKTRKPSPAKRKAAKTTRGTKKT